MRILLGVIHRNDPALKALSADIFDHLQPLVVWTRLNEKIVEIGEGVVLPGRGHHLSHLLGILYTGADRVVDVVDLLAEHGAVHHAAVHDQHVVGVLEGALLVGRKGQEICKVELYKGRKYKVINTVIPVCACMFDKNERYNFDRISPNTEPAR